MAEPSGSNFPTSLDDATSLLAAVTNQKSFVVSGAHGGGATTITVTGAISGVTAPGYVINGRTGEIVHFGGISGSDFTGCTRGADGTSSTGMNDLDVLYHASVAKYHNQLRAAAIAIETILGVSPNVIDDTVAASASPTSVAQYLDMVANRLKAITGEASWVTAPDASLSTLNGYFSTLTWTNFTYEHGWVDYDTTYNPGGYVKDPFGWVHLRGLVRTGTVGTSIATLPAGYRPSHIVLWDSQANGALCRTDVNPSGTVVASSGSNAWWSLEGCVWLAYQ